MQPLLELSYRNKPNTYDATLGWRQMTGIGPLPDRKTKAWRKLDVAVPTERCGITICHQIGRGMHRTRVWTP